MINLLLMMRYDLDSYCIRKNFLVFADNKDPQFFS